MTEDQAATLLLFAETLLATVEFGVGCLLTLAALAALQLSKR